MKTIGVLALLMGIGSLGYAGSEVTATATATAVAPAGSGSVGTAPVRYYRPAWGTVRVIQREVIPAQVVQTVVPATVVETVAVPRRDRIRLRLVREPRPDRIFQRIGYASAGAAVGYGSSGQ